VGRVRGQVDAFASLAGFCRALALGGPILRVLIIAR
jgi:hypothetical protein